MTSERDVLRLYFDGSHSQLPKIEGVCFEEILGGNNTSLF